MLVENGERDTSTKCAADGLTAAEIGGYDADTGKLVAEALGAEACKLGVEALGAEACFVAAVLLDTGFAG